MKILTKEMYQLMQKVGTHFPKERIDEIKKTAGQDSSGVVALLEANWRPYPSFYEDKHTVDSCMRDYYRHEHSAEEGVLSPLRSLFDLHDAKITSISYNDPSLDIIIDSSGSMGRTKEIHFVGCTVESQGELENAVILYVELYGESNNLTVDMLIDDSKSQVREIEFRAKGVFICPNDIA